MRQVPTKCPGCGEHNIHNLDYCAICGKKFTQRGPARPPAKKKGGLSKEQKIKAKRLKKRNELTELYKKKKISVEQYSAGLRKLGYSTDMDKAMAFKKYIREQIKSFEQLQVDPNAKEGDTYFDPNASNSALPRDEYGNVITDFSIDPNQGSQTPRPTESVPTVDHGSTGSDSTGGPRFGMSLFGERREREEKRVVDKPLKRSRIDSSSDTLKRNSPRRRKAMADWDDDDEEDEEDEDEDSDFEMDLSDGKKGKSGWWDDDKWELEWTDEDEEEYDEWEMDLDEDEEEKGWVLEFDDDEEDEDDHGYDVSFDDDDEEVEDEDDLNVTFEDDEDREDEEEEFEIVEEDEDDLDDDDDDDWSRPRRRKRRNR